MQKLTKSKITGDVVSIFLLQLAPGKETEAAKAFGEDCFVFKGLGKYDIIAIKEENGHEFTNTTESFLNNMKGNLPSGTLDWMTICGFKRSISSKRCKKITGKDVLGICCIKLDFPVKTVHPLEYEEQIIEKILNAFNDVHVYSGLGYNEIICLIERETIEELTTVINKIKELSIGTNGESLFLDINTIPTVNFDCIGKGNVPKGNVEAVIMINLKTGAPIKLDKQIEKYFRTKGSLLFGFHDIITEVKVSTNELVNKMIELRTDLVDFGLYSTCTLVKHFDSDLEVHPKIEWKNIEDNYHLKTKQIPDELIYYHDVYSVLRNDPFTKNLLLNFPEVLNALINDHEDATKCLPSEEDMKEFQSLMRTYHAVLGVINTFFQQRLSGKHIGNLLGPKSLSIETIGGIQRLIYALESVPFFLLKEIGLEWDGFGVFGHYHSFRSWFSHEILAMPRKFMMKPKYLWGMNHESGHIAFLKLLNCDSDFERLMNIQYDKHKKKIQEYLKEYKKEGISENQISDFCFAHYSDVFADMFDFCYGFKCDWETYKNTVWKYLKEFGPVGHVYVTRSLLVFLLVGPGSAMDEDSAIEEFFKQLRTFFNDFKYSFKQIKKDAIRFSEVLKETSKVMASLINSYKQKINLIEISKQIDEVKNELIIGNLIIDVDPTIIVQAILDVKNCPKAKFAAILSLYDQGRMNYFL